MSRAWRQDSPYGEITVVVSEHGVSEISLPGDDQPAVEVGAPDTKIKRALDDYFAGRAHTCDIPIDLTEVNGFRRTVLETLVRDVPWGETVSYGELAAMAGRPRAARAVGSAMRTNPLPFVVPCHRVIASGGKIGGYGGGRNAVELKRELLAREGVEL